MSHPYRREISYSFGGPLTPAVKALIIANCAVYLLQVLSGDLVTRWFWLAPLEVLPWSFQIWRVGTYMFLHGSPMHLLFNMLALFIFGCSIERTWGTRSFYRYYFLCGLGGALFSFIPISDFYTIPIIGASGAVYGILVAYGVLFPYNKIYVFLTFPVEARYFVMFWGFLAFVFSLGGGDGIAHIVHLGGLVTGFALLRWAGVGGWSRRYPARAGPVQSLHDAYRRWRMKRLRKKFESYYEKRANDDPPPPIH